MCRTMKELERVVADYRSMKAMKEQIDAEVKSLEYEIIGYMDANEKLTETGNDFTIKLSTCERRTVDTKRLEADLGSLAEYFGNYEDAEEFSRNVPQGTACMIAELKSPLI